ncbi:CCHC-type domain-containing protein [Raphanus sativus]|nr:CCHC-type domain-containing protein [Raphanus sativus]
MAAPSVTVSDKSSAPPTIIFDNNSVSPPAIFSDNQPPDHSPALAITGAPPLSHSSPSNVDEVPPPVISDETNDSDSDSQDEVFVPTLGAWAKPLLFRPPATPTSPSTPTENNRAKVGNQLAALWPTLNDSILNTKPKTKRPTRSLMPPVEKLPLPELKADASPTYRLDGTPEISIPSKVLKLGPENKDEYIIGKFHKCSLPPGGLIHAIIQRGVWHIDDCLLFVLPWIPEGSFIIPEISTLPVWVNLKQIPDCCYSRLGISHIASGLGEPILTHKPRLDPTSMGEANVLVEMELDRDFPKLIALDDKQGHIFLVEVEYTWIPFMCERCGNLGHKEKRCLLPSKPVDEHNSPEKVMVGPIEIPVMDIDRILKERGYSSTPSLPIQTIAANLQVKRSEEANAADAPSATIKDPIVTAHDQVDIAHDSS